jgi:uncharacterized protein with FMN-binding domain
VKKKILIGIAVLLLALIAAVGITVSQTKVLPHGDITQSLAQAEDGTYTGSCNDGLIFVKLEVTVEDHAITGISILEHRNGKGAAAERITEDIMQAQSLDVEAVTGATVSSSVIRKAVENALCQ